jgi:hypothetical protein
MLKSLALPQFISGKPASARPAVNYKAPRSNARKFVSLDRGQLLVSYALIAASGALLLMYLFGVNNNATKGYEIKRLQTGLQQLSETNQKLNLQTSEQSAITVVQNDFDRTQFVPLAQVKYLQMNQYSVRAGDTGAN